LIALLNPLCDLVVDGGTGQAIQILSNLPASNVSIDVGQPVNGANQPIQGANASTNAVGIYSPDGTQTNGAQIYINPNGEFFNGYNGRFGLSDQQNQVVTTLHEIGHAIDYLDDGLANGTNGTLIAPDDPQSAPGASLQNSQLIANNCT